MVSVNMFLTGGSGYLIYLAKVRDAPIILIGGGTKNKQQKDIDKAKNLHTEYKQPVADNLWKNF